MLRLFIIFMACVWAAARPFVASSALMSRVGRHTCAGADARHDSRRSANSNGRRRGGRGMGAAAQFMPRQPAQDRSAARNARDKLSAPSRQSPSGDVQPNVWRRGGARSPPLFCSGPWRPREPARCSGQLSGPLHFGTGKRHYAGCHASSASAGGRGNKAAGRISVNTLPLPFAGS